MHSQQLLLKYFSIWFISITVDINKCWGFAAMMALSHTLCSTHLRQSVLLVGATSAPELISRDPNKKSFRNITWRYKLSYWCLTNCIVIMYRYLRTFLFKEMYHGSILGLLFFLLAISVTLSHFGFASWNIECEIDRLHPPWS